MKRFCGDLLAGAAFVALAGASGAAHAAIIQQFEGVDLVDFAFAAGSAVTPPDMGGAVSAYGVIQATNGGVKIFDKLGNLQSYQTSAAFLAAAGVPNTGYGGSQPFDPRLTYDASSGRFFGVYENLGPAGSGPDFADPNGASFPKLGDGALAEEENGIASTPNNPIYVFVSNDSNPMHGFQAVKFNTSKSLFGDFPTLGVSGDALTIGTNDFDDNSLQSVSVFSIPKADLLGATPSVANMSRFEGLDPALVGFAVQAVNKTSANGEQMLVAISATNWNEVDTSQLFFNGSGKVNGANAYGPSAIAFDGSPNLARQPDPSVPLPLDSGDDRISSAITQVGNFIYLTHGYGDGLFGPSTYSAVAWEIMDATTGQVVAEGAIQDPNMDYYYASIAPSADGKTFLLAYNGSGTGTVISAFAEICSFSASTAAVSCGPQQLIKTGIDPGYELNFGGDRNRWGDYSAAQWDDSTHSWWLFQEYPGQAHEGFADTSPEDTGRWRTIITQVAAVPEPGTWAMMLLGFGGLGALMRGRRRAVLAA